MKKVKQRVFSGCVCEQVIFFISNNVKNLKAAKPRQRFRTEEERELHKEKIARKRHAQQFNATYNPQSLYSTLTLDDENEVHTFDEARRLGTNYWRRLKRANPRAQFHLYMGRGKHTSRIHFHLVSNGLTEDEIAKEWGYGSVVRVEHLREHNFYDGVDHGQDYTGLANYLFDHWTPEQGGHRYRATRNISKPENEEPTLVKRNYTAEKPPRMPEEYKLVEYEENEFGYQYFKYVYKPKKRKRK